MGTSTRLSNYPMRGLLVPDTRITLATVAAATDAAYSVANTAYTEAAPHPGSDVPADARATARIALSGEQSQPLTFVAEAAGMPVATGGRWAYYKGATQGVAAEAATAKRGWNAPNVPVDYATIETDTTNPYVLSAAVTIPSTQKVVALYWYNSGLAPFYTATYTPSTATWAARVTLSSVLDALGTTGSGTLWVGANERVYALIWSGTKSSLYYSDDVGATWVFAGANAFVSAPSISALRPHAHVVGADVALICANGTTIYQQASSTLGTTFVALSTPAATWDNIASCLTASGKIVVVGRVGGTTFPVAWSLGSAWQPIAGSSPVVVDATRAVSELAVWADPSGPVYCIGRSAGDTYLWISTDDGATWARLDYGAGHISVIATAPRNIVPVACNGGMLMLTQWISATGAGGGAGSTIPVCISSIMTGGWSQFTTVEDSASAATNHISRTLGFGYHATNIEDQTWVPFTRPTDYAAAFWTTNGAGTDVLSTSGYTTLTSTNVAGQNIYFSHAFATNMTACVVLFDVGVVTGDAPTAGGGTKMGSEIIVSDSIGNTYDTQVRVGPAGIMVTSNAAQLGSTAAVTMTGQRVQILHMASAGLVDVYYRLRGTTAWTQVVSSSSAHATVSGANGSVRFGNVVVATTITSVARWAQHHIVALASGTSPIWGIGTSGTATATHIVGKALTAYPCPLGDAATAGATFAAVADGPALVAESHVVANGADYAFGNVFYQIAPSPRAAWRSTSTAQQQWVVNVDAANVTTHGTTTLAFAVLNSNIRTLLVEGVAADGVTATTLAAFDSRAFTGLKYSVTGDVVRVNGTGSTAWRAIRRGELVGADFVCDNGTVHGITRHQEGLWSATGGLSGKQSELIINAGSGAADATGTAGSIVPRNWVGYIHNITTAYRKLRFTIATVTTSAGYFQIGQLIIGTFQPVGKQWSFGNIYQFARNQETVTTRDGVARTRKLGPPIKSVTVSLDAADQTALNGSQPTPDYLSAKTGYPGLVNQYDTPWLLAGLLEELDSGAVPVVALLSVPDGVAGVGPDSGVITDPELFVYGRVGDVQLEVVRGNEGDYVRGEVVRLQSFKISGLP